MASKKAKCLRLILGDQLNYSYSWFREVDDSVVYVMMEVRQETDYVKHHIQKVCGFFAAMRSFAQWLREAGHRLEYVVLDDPENTQSIPGNIERLLEKYSAQRFEYQLPDEYRLDRQLSQLCDDLPHECAAVDSEHFLTSRNEVGEFFEDKKVFRMENFYRYMRRKHDILMEVGGPVGGKWNYDVENRKRYAGEVPIPSGKSFSNDVSDIHRMLKKSGVETFGQIEPQEFIWPVTRDQAQQTLTYFLTYCLPHFGTYQDAMTTIDPFLFHSRLSFALNTKMLSPLEVIEKAVAAWQRRQEDISLAQIEGFVRQILGWREYVRGVYWRHMPGYGRRNYFRNEVSLPHFYWDGETKMNCMRHAIGQSLEHGYAHHIQRLMITGNFALLAGIHPDEVDAWYLGVYIDAIEWVEMPNTRGMSQFADGGIMGTKPYVSSANYINKMSDYCKGCHYDHKKRHGDTACPFNSLYWAFHDRHRDKLTTNPRVGQVYRTWDRMKKEERDRTLAQAQSCRRRLEEL